ncbi:hypothetical protein B5G11_12150 [Drancourtella sp. An57]|uniref:ABC transporter substrate-binding protein n=1 Tax=Drancourtella sp. An57 TaxID=1965647 RepID=UPI000B37C128|nr:extracellular solute-binding protein [Drancourtella sp. An57]OUN68703.1 hypothetical protein B5G11_12150 [Drancourtella sp. An57]
MRKQNMIRKGMSVLCVCALAAGLCSCGTEEKSEEEKILRVVTDGTLYTDVEFAARFLEGVDGEIEVRIQRLPDDKEKREIEIQKLRTKIMAGKGPDVYLLESVRENAAEAVMPLLENPYQTMQSGALASLDEFMEKDSYWEDNTYHEAILKAGQYDGRQYIIPMSVMYYVLPRPDDMEKMKGDTLQEWMQQAVSSDDFRLKQAFYGLTLQTARWIQPAADYEKAEVKFDKERWKELAQDCIQFDIDVQDEVINSDIDSRFVFKDSMEVLYYNEQSPLGLQVVPDIEGRKMASIMSYGAVGMSSDLKQEAYDFLMLFLNDRTQKYQKEHSEDSMKLPAFYGYLDKSFTPVQENAFEVWMNYPSEEVLQEMQQSFRELDGAYFLTGAERELFEGLDQIAGNCSRPGYDWSAEIDKLVDSVWNTYKMMVSE